MASRTRYEEALQQIALDGGPGEEDQCVHCGHRIFQPKSWWSGWVHYSAPQDERHDARPPYRCPCCSGTLIPWCDGAYDGASCRNCGYGYSHYVNTVD